MTTEEMLARVDANEALVKDSFSLAPAYLQRMYKDLNSPYRQCREYAEYLVKWFYDWLDSRPNTSIPMTFNGYMYE